MKNIFALLGLIVLTVSSYGQNLSSPNAELELNFELNSDGTPVYALQYKGEAGISR